MKRILLPALFCAVLVGYGIAEGFWTNRWYSSADLEQATARLSQVPRIVGDWEGIDHELEARQVAQAEINGYVLRRYVNQKTGASVNVMLVCGRPGPTSLHSPEVCYPGAGFNQAGAPERKVIGGKSEAAQSDFWVGKFQKVGPIPETLQIFWAWNGAGSWQAADSPRFQFAHHAALYKLYVIRELPRTDEAVVDDPSVDFLEHFLPEVRRALFGETAK